jgi:hypothetical protein
VLVVAGWAIIAASGLLGARVWFDLLSKMNTLRSSGPRPHDN